MIKFKGFMLGSMMLISLGITTLCAEGIRYSEAKGIVMAGVASTVLVLLLVLRGIYG